MLIILGPQIGGFGHHWIASYISDLGKRADSRSPSFWDITTNPAPCTHVEISFRHYDSPIGINPNSPSLYLSVEIPVLNKINIGVEHRYEYCDCDVRYKKTVDEM